MSELATEANDKPPDLPAPWADVGLVVVHGIGEQARGATLLDWAEPITRRLDEITTGVDVIRSQIAEDDGSEVRLLVRVAEGRECRVIIREARWADAFLTVSSSDVLAWGRRFSVRALTRLVAHLRRTLRMVGRRGSARSDQLATLIEAIAAKLPNLPFVANLSVVSAGVRLVGALVVAVTFVGGLGLVAVFGPLALLMIFVGTVLLAALAKVPVLGKRLHAVLAGLVLTVGDATSWTERPLRAAAMRDRVRDEITSIDARKVIVLGHSQGAAVATEAVLGSGAAVGDRVSTLVTVGGAVSLLRRPRWSAKRSDPVPGAVARWSARSNLGWANIWATWDPVPSGPVTDEDGDATSRWQEMYAAALERIENDTDTAAADLARRTQPTFGVLGTDAVLPTPLAKPAGKVPTNWSTQHVRSRESAKGLAALAAGKVGAGFGEDGSSEVAGPAEWAVHNRASILADHTTYTSNIRQVIDPLARLLVDVSGHGAGVPVANAGAVIEHVDAVRMLGALRVSALVTSVVGLTAITSRGIELPIIDWLVRAVRPVSGASADGLSWLQEQSWQGYVQFVVAAALAAAVLVAAGSALWGRWHRALSWDDSRSPAVPRAMFTGYYALTVLTPAALATMELDDALGWWVWLVAGAIAVVVIIWPGLGPRPQPLRGRRLPSAPR